MHPSAMHHGKLFFQTYAKQGDSISVVDVGAQNVNGSLRQACPAHCKYIGVDFVDGEGVDVVLDDPYQLPFRDESVDIVVSSSCLEHSEMFWLLFLEMLRVLKPNGLLYLNVPTNGSFHRYPVDCWRFYPDSAGALVSWARRNKLNPVLLESFIGKKSKSGSIEENDWNDYVAVFLKDISNLSDHPNRILHKLAEFENGTLHGVANFLNTEPYPENSRHYFDLFRSRELAKNGLP